ncbi:hypothetical protein J3A83DRAFT_4191262 [Scleroderma citrinum]
MLNTSLPTGWYTITANTGPVDFCNVNGETRVVVFDGQRFHLERLDNGTYVISSIILGGVVQTTADYRLVFYPGQQRWIVTQYDDQADTYTITEANDPSLAWTDGGGPPGCNHWLYVNEFDPNDIPAAQQFRIVPVSGMRGTIYQRKVPCAYCLLVLVKPSVSIQYYFYLSDTQNRCKVHKSLLARIDVLTTFPAYKGSVTPSRWIVALDAFRPLKDFGISLRQGCIDKPNFGFPRRFRFHYVGAQCLVLGCQLRVLYAIKTSKVMGHAAQGVDPMRPEILPKRSLGRAPSAR